MNKKPNREQAEEAVRTLIRWIGEDPNREGLQGTPERVLKSYQEFFSGYTQNESEILSKTFSENNNYSNVVSFFDIPFRSFCEHHILPIIGSVYVSYIPDNKVIGLSKISRIIDVFANRLQIQERLTVDIANSIHNHLQPKGVAVCIKASHHCMSIRGVNKSGIFVNTYEYKGEFLKDLEVQRHFVNGCK